MENRVLENNPRLSVATVNNVLQRNYGRELVGYLYQDENRERVLRVYQDSCGLNERQAKEKFEELLQDAEETLNGSGRTFSRSKSGINHTLPRKVRL
jgi:hypothetical protein